MKKLVAVLLCSLLMLSTIPAMADEYSDMLDKANTYIESGDNDKALACFQLAEKVQPDNEMAYLCESRLHIQMENYEQAESAVSIALDKNYISADAWTVKCQVDIGMKRIDAFDEDAVFAEVCGADISSLYVDIAMLYADNGRYEDAVSYFKQCEISSLSEEQRSSYCRALLACGKREEAIDQGLMIKAARNDALDKAFDSNKLYLQRVEMPIIKAENFAFPDAMWDALDITKPLDPYADLDIEISNSNIVLYSLSQTGKSGILEIDNAKVAYYNGEYRIIYPSSTRGVPDEYGNLSKFCSTALRSLIGDEGVVYSHDGRYASLFNTDISLMKGQFFLDPIVIDLSTGEAILTATYQNKAREDNAGVVTTACFSADDRYLYYILYGRTSDYRTTLYRYDFKTSSTEKCFTGYDTTYYPKLSETMDGSLIIINDTMLSDGRSGLVDMSISNGIWESSEYGESVTIKYWYASRLMYSQNTGNAILTGNSRLSQGINFACQYFRPDDEIWKLDEFLTVSLETDEIEVISASNIESIVKTWSQDGKSLIDFPYCRILCAQLSPDGNYLLLLTSNHIGTEDETEMQKLLLVRLDDMETREIMGINANQILFGSAGNSFRPTIEWNCDTLLINTADGIAAYCFEISD